MGNLRKFFTFVTWEGENQSRDEIELLFQSIREKYVQTRAEGLYMDGQTKDSHKGLPGTTYCLGLHGPTIKELYSGQKVLVD